MSTFRTALAITLAAGVSLAALAGTAQAQEKSYRIGAAVYGLQNEYAQRWTKDLKDHPAVKSGMAKIDVFDGRYDHMTQSGQFDTMITQHEDGAIYVTIDSIACDAVLKKANEANLPVVDSNSPCKTDKALSYIGSDDVEGGRRVAKAVIAAMKGPGEVIELEGPVGQLASAQRGQGMKEVLDQHPEIKLITSKTANWSRSEAMKLFTNWLTAYPGRIKGVLAQNDEMGLGAIAAMKAAGMDPKSIPVAGIDGVSDAIRAVNDGDMVLSVAQDSKAQAQGGLDIMLRHLVGASYKPESTIWEQYKDQMPWGDGTAKLYNVPWTDITKTNAASFLK